MKILVAGGGTGGHVNPAIAMANNLRTKYPDAEFLFVGSKHGLENDLVPKEGYKIARIPVKGFSRKGFFSKIWPYMVLVAGMVKSFFIYLKFRPDMAFGTGGYASGPILFWTSLFKVPTLIHEANVLPGITNRMLTSRADITAICFPESKEYLKKAKRIELTGNPIRKKILKAGRSSSRAALELGIDDKLVVLMGGSQGAKPINDAAVEMLRDIYKDGDFKLIFAPGKRHYVAVSSVVNNKFENVEIPSYIYDADIVYSAADLIVNRAGASTISEIAALGVPSILIPSPYVAENHQEKNAKTLEENGGCIMLRDRELSGQVLYDNIRSIIDDDERLMAMRKAAASVGIRDASEKLEKLFDELLGR
jgi:UDP-N-acetylglucosamine--N-acetylmuramyl-(pentapeptide) pyrophosphoryl-undecaprenol N-acetylglucosamine transferase